MTLPRKIYKSFPRFFSFLDKGRGTRGSGGAVLAIAGAHEAGIKHDSAASINLVVLWKEMKRSAERVGADREIG